MTSLDRATVLKTEFFNRDPRKVARALLGKLLIRQTKAALLAGRIVETEAYLGENDDAAHAAAGKTPRNEVLFGPPGYAYVYFIYGVHYCLNVSCREDGRGGGVLFRALEPVGGIEEMAEARGLDIEESTRGLNISFLKKISSGPGRLSEAFDITRARDNGKNLASARSDLRLVDDGYRPCRVAITARIGIVKSAELPLRYLIAANPFVSGRRSAAL
jgi:DNA-3-methyladenine glycosylase